MAMTRDRKMKQQLIFSTTHTLKKGLGSTEQLYNPKRVVVVGVWQLAVTKPRHRPVEYYKNFIYFTVQLKK